MLHICSLLCYIRSWWVLRVEYSLRTRSEMFQSERYISVYRCILSSRLHQTRLRVSLIKAVWDNYLSTLSKWHLFVTDLYFKIYSLQTIKHQLLNSNLSYISPLLPSLCTISLLSFPFFSCFLAHNEKQFFRGMIMMPIEVLKKRDNKMA